jgi:hypothetical protein
MKKLIGTTLGILSPLAVAFPAFAGTNVETCPKGQFGTLCKLDATKIGSVISGVVTILLIAATIIALFFLIFGGIRWVTSGGDKAKVESARNTIIAAIIGLVIAFLAYFILTLVLSFFGLSLTNIQIPNLTAV